MNDIDYFDIDKLTFGFNDLERVYDLPITDKESYIIYDALEEYYESKLGTDYFENFIRPNVNKLMDKILKFQIDNRL